MRQTANGFGARTRLRGAVSTAFRLSTTLVAVAVGALFLWVLVTVGWRGVLALSSSDLAAAGVVHGAASGLADAVIGSVIVVALAFTVAVPVGLVAGVFIAEVGRNSRWLGAVRFMADVLSGVPAVVAGVFVYFALGGSAGGQGLLPGALALAVLMMPMLACTTSRTLERLSPSLREAGWALGAPPWRSLIQVSMRAAAPGILSAGLLAVARVAGQVAPLLLVMPAGTEAAASPGAMMPTLHVEAYRLLMTSDPQAPSLAWTAALLLTAAITVVVWLAGRLGHLDGEEG